MSAPRTILIVGGLALTIWGMSYGLYYAIFDEHQTLGRMGASLAGGFSSAAQRKMLDASASIDDYADARFEYVREVDVHSHWIGLAMFLIVMGMSFDRVAFGDITRLLLAGALFVGSVAFPLGVMLQTADCGEFPRALAAGGSLLVIAALGAVAIGMARDWRRT